MDNNGSYVDDCEDKSPTQSTPVPGDSLQVNGDEDKNQIIIIWLVDLSWRALTSAPADHKHLTGGFPSDRSHPRLPKSGLGWISHLVMGHYVFSRLPSRLPETGSLAPWLTRLHGHRIFLPGCWNACARCRRRENMSSSICLLHFFFSRMICFVCASYLAPRSLWSVPTYQNIWHNP